MKSEDLAAVARQLPYRDPSPSELAAVRAQLLAATRDRPPASASSRRWPWAIAAAVAALVGGAAAWTVLRVSDPAMRATVEASAGAQFSHTSTWLRGGQADEVVRLKAGRVHLEVRKLERGERFRVVAGDGEVEVRGTAFDVMVDGDHLEAVRVDHGWVEVRPNGQESALLGAGEQWHAAVPVVTEAESPASPVVATPSPVAKRMAPPRAEAPEPPAPAEEEIAEPPPPAAPAANPQEAAFARGWDALRGAQPGIAAEAFHEAWGGTPEGPISEDAQFWESVALARARRSGPAIAAMEAFLERYPRSVRAGELSVMLGWLLLDNGSPDAARARFEAARADPNPAVREGARKGLSAVQGSSSSTRPP